MRNDIEEEDSFYLPQLFASGDARRVAVEAFALYAGATIGKDRAIAEGLRRYFEREGVPNA